MRGLLRNNILIIYQILYEISDDDDISYSFIKYKNKKCLKNLSI